MENDAPLELDRGNPGKTWMYTINNYTDKDEEFLQRLECSYHVYGREVGEKGTPHLQGCITFKKAMRFSKVSRLIKGHLTRPKVVEAARNYCMKDGDVFVKDNRVGQGSRSDLHEVCDFLKSGGSLRDTAIRFGPQFVKYSNGITKYRELVQVQPKRTWQPVVHWYYGATGSGKSWAVFDAEEDVWVHTGDLRFFNAYENQPAVLFDDFRGCHAKFSFMLTLLDRYPMYVDVKHSFRTWNPRRIYVTSSKHPSECYDRSEQEDMDQLLRRITNIVKFERVPAGTKRTAEKGSFVPGPSIEEVPGE